MTPLDELRTHLIRYQEDPSHFPVVLHQALRRLRQQALPLYAPEQIDQSPQKLV